MLKGAKQWRKQKVFYRKVAAGRKDELLHFVTTFCWLGEQDADPEAAGRHVVAECNRVGVMFHSWEWL